MADEPAAVPPHPPTITIPVSGSAGVGDVTIPVGGSAGFGELTITPPTFLEKWGVVFVAIGGVWMLGVCIAMLSYYLTHLSLPPAQPAGMRPEDYQAMLGGHKTAVDQFRDSVNFVFDLMVTKTVLPLLTLLLGYLFGSKRLER